MKISILTPAYNRGEKLNKLYTSLLVNNNSNVDIEWLVMDDGSTDKTKYIITNFIKQNIINIKYYYQENQGKMAALNNLVRYATGDVIIECDSDDYFTVGAFDTIAKYEDKLQDGIYALVFLKYDQNGNNMGNNFPENLHRSDMFSLYFRENVTGEKALVFNSHIRKQFEYKLEADEKFVTEARMYHQMDLEYDVVCINEPIMICEYQKDGYSKNIQKVFKENPLGYYEYFREILEMDLTGVTLKKRLYIYKHYVLFSILAERDHAIRNVAGIINKIIVAIMWIPGLVKTKQMFNLKDEDNNDEELEYKEKQKKIKKAAKKIKRNKKNK